MSKAIIGEMDMMVAGRVHSSVASVSQYVPTVFIPYNNSMNSTKILGFSTLTGMQEFVSTTELEDIINGELGDLVFMGESVNMQGHAVLLSNLPEFAKDSEGNIDKTTIILKTLSTSSESDPGNFGEKSYIFKQQKEGRWQQVGGAEYIFRGYGQLNKNLENN